MRKCLSCPEKFLRWGLRLMCHPVGPTTRHVVYALTARNTGVSEYFSHYNGITVFLRHVNNRYDKKSTA